MATPIAQSRTMTGIRRTSSSDTVRFIVEAYHNFGDGEVDSVEFNVIDGNNEAGHIVTSRDLWMPNDTDVNDPLPVKSGGPWGGTGPAPIWAFGYEVPMTLQSGTITVDATVYPTQGDSYTLPTLTIYNHKSSEQPPSTNVIYCSPTGSNSNNGLSTGAPVQSIQWACRLARNSSKDVGGAKIYLMAGTHQWAFGGLAGAYGQAEMETTGDYWLTIEPDPAASAGSVIVTRQADANNTWLQVINPGSNPATFRLRLRKLVIETPGLAIYCQSSVTTHVWLDGCEERSAFTSSISLAIYDSCDGLHDQAVTVDGPHYRYVTGGSRHHVFDGWHGWTMVRGCKMENYIGVALQCTEDNQWVCNLYLKTHRYQTGVNGWFAAITGLFDITVPSTGVMRLTARNSSVPDFKPAVTYLIGLQRMGILVFDAVTDTPDNGVFKVIGSGYASGSGLPYVDLDNPDAGAYSPANSITVRVATVTTGVVYEDLVHPDILQVNCNPVNYMLTNVRSWDIAQSQGIYAGNKTLTRCVFVNVAIGTDGNSWFVVDDVSGTGGVDHVLLRHITTLANWLFEQSTRFSYTRFEVYDCAFDTASYNHSGGALSANAANNHFRTSISFGTNATTSTNGVFWADSNPASSGDYSASATGPGNHAASSAWARPISYTYSSGVPDKGAWLNVSKPSTQGGGW